ncbi:MAG TPA: ABC transporter permease subunit [Actinomycetota bacterium]|nr:ABC transporter permease subunit [Actinomycetota bacterium]
MTPGRRTETLRRFRRTAMFLLALVLVTAIWELYKLVGPPDGGTVFGWTILPRANDIAMPHVWEMLSRYADPERRGSSTPIAVIVLQGAWFTFRIAIVGFAIGTLLGLGLAVLMARFKVVERGLLPYLVISQTVPLIALAPLVVSWGGRLSLGAFEWPRWLSAAVMGAFLAFFPVAVGTLKGLTSTPPASLELMASYAASWRQTLFKLRFPAAVPFMIPALKLAATASVIGVIVAELSTGLAGGVGRLIIEYARQATGDPSKVFTAVIVTALLGLVMVGLVGLADVTLMRNRPRETVE